MQTFVVGGAVRDRILGLEPKDRDFVVVGATPEEMIEKGFTQVGADFPVFLDQNGDEFALARTERKTASGHRGFETRFNPNVTLKEDLARRDFTMNAMAEHPDTGEIIDPFGGQHDIKARTIRHVSDAFGEDPLRVLRAARFSARLGFTIAPGTMELMRGMVRNGDLAHLTPERVWQEIARAMNEQFPHRFFAVLNELDALEIIFDEAGWIFFGVTQALNTLSTHEVGENERWMGIFMDLHPEDVELFLKSLPVPNDIARAAMFSSRFYSAWFKSVDHIMDVCGEFRIWSDATLLDELVETVRVIEPWRLEQFQGLAAAIKTAAQVSFDSLTEKEQKNLKGPAIGVAIANKRREFINEWWIST